MSPFGGNEFPGGSGSGSGGGGSVPKNLIIGGASESVATIEIPGLSGSPDIIPSSPSTFSDEFDENAAGTPSGWTSTAGLFGTITTLNTDDAKSFAHILAGSGDFINGIFKAGPTSFPITVIAKLSDCALANANCEAGLYAGAQAPGVAGTLYLIQITGVNGGASVVQTGTAVSATGVPGSGSTVGSWGVTPMYFKIVITATTITRYWSYNGMVWQAVAAVTGLTISAPYVGIFANTNGGQSGEAYFDYVRFS